jgi:hypothetical protein
MRGFFIYRLIMANIFGLVPADLRKVLNPLDQDELFGGDNSDVVDADVQVQLDTQSDYIQSRIPEKYRPLLSHIGGEILTKCAPVGTTTLITGLTPVTNVKLYRNFPSPSLSLNSSSYPGVVRLDSGNFLWKDRNVEFQMPSTEYSVTSAGVITFTPALGRGDSVVAEYDHTATASCLMLRLMALRLTAVEYARMLPYISVEPWERQVHVDIKRMYDPSDGRLGIQMIDQLNLVEETRDGKNVRGRPALGGW